MKQNIRKAPTCTWCVHVDYDTSKGWYECFLWESDQDMDGFVCGWFSSTYPMDEPCEGGKLNKEVLKTIDPAMIVKNK